MTKARAIAVTAFLLAPAGMLLAQPGPTRWSPDDRVVIGDFSHITSLAAGPDRVYVTSPTALVIWDPRFHRWEGPFEPPNPAVLQGVFASLLDPLDYSVWLVHPRGWVHYDPNIDLWDSGVVPFGVETIAFDGASPASDLYLRTNRGWYSLPRGAMVPSPSPGPRQPAGPLSVQQVLRENPWFEANQAAVLRTARMGMARYTVAARSYDRQGWYLGTAGAGLLYASALATLPEPLSFGLPSPVVGAIWSGPRGLWVATDRTAGAPAAVTFVRPDLEEFRPIQGSSAFGVEFNRATDMLGQGSSLWIASDIGLVRIENDGRSVTVIDESRGLPDRRINAMSTGRGRVTLGTERGLATIDDALEVTVPAAGFAGAVLSVAASGDTVWAGTRVGLLVALPDSAALLRPSGLGEPSTRVPVVDLAWVADTLVALTRDRLQWRDPTSLRWTVGPTLSALLGRLVRVLPDEGGVWVAGERGVGFAGLETPPLQPLLVGRDLPAEPTDLAVDSEFLWVATPRGLVRWRLAAVRP